MTSPQASKLSVASSQESKLEVRSPSTEHQVMKLACCSLTVTGCLLSSYIRATALSSPDMILGVTGGGALVVITWVAIGALFSYVTVVVAGMCRISGYLFVCGVVTQICSASGVQRHHDTPQGQPREIVIKRVGLKIDVFRFPTMKPSSQ